MKVTTWAPKGVKPDLKSGRWVQIGGPSLLNFWLTGLPGGKMFLSSRFPFFSYRKNDADFDNYLTVDIQENMLQLPRGFGPDGYIKALFGQRRVK